MEKGSKRRGHKFNAQTWETRCSPLGKWVPVEEHPMTGSLVCSHCGTVVVSGEKRNDPLPELAIEVEGRYA